MDPIITNALMTFGAGFTGATFSKAKGPGQALDDVMTLVGFDRLHEVAEKKKAKRELNIQLYKDSIAQKIVAIPEEDLKDPPLAIVGPALEASKYYIEEAVLREMFANLISSSMNKNKELITHTSYAEIIKQLTPLDGENLKCILSSRGSSVVCNIGISFSNGGSRTFFYNVFLENKECTNQKLLSSSLDNLKRLGLVDIDYGKSKSDDSTYDNFELTSEFLDIQQRIDRQNSAVESGQLPSDAYSVDSVPMMEKGIVRLTTFGENFCATCL